MPRRDLPAPPHPETPDRRYFVVRGRQWRRSNPELPEDLRGRLVNQLMRARRDVGAALRSGDASKLADARRAVNVAKVALGERGPVWWTDGSPDLNRRMAVNTPYREWFVSLTSTHRQSPE